MKTDVQICTLKEEKYDKDSLSDTIWGQLPEPLWPAQFAAHEALSSLIKEWPLSSNTEVFET